MAVVQVDSAIAAWGNVSQTIQPFPPPGVPRGMAGDNDNSGLGIQVSNVKDASTRVNDLTRESDFRVYPFRKSRPASA
jgi:hypothetical protein